MAVWNVNLYSRGITEASKSVLLEFLRILGSYGDYLVLSGGWTPYFILEKFGEANEHCGSIDIDFVLDPKLADLRVYETIVSMIEKRGYKLYETENGEVLPYRFYRSIRSPLDDQDYDIEIDFITEPQVLERLHPSILLAVQKDLQAVVIRGSSIVFSHNFEHTIEGILPSGAETKVNCKIADPTGCLVMKSLALKGRYKEKDPYDIYYLLRHYRGGPEKVGREVRKYLGEPLVREAVDEIRQRFRTPRSDGPFQVAYFLAPEDEAARERIQGDAFTTIRLFLKDLT